MPRIQKVFCFFFTKKKPFLPCPITKNQTIADPAARKNPATSRVTTARAPITAPLLIVTPDMITTSIPTHTSCLITTSPFDRGCPSIPHADLKATLNGKLVNQSTRCAPPHKICTPSAVEQNCPTTKQRPHRQIKPQDCRTKFGVPSAGDDADVRVDDDEGGFFWFGSCW